MTSGDLNEEDRLLMNAPIHNGTNPLLLFIGLAVLIGLLALAH